MRTANGIVSAALVTAFLVHAFMGSVWLCARFDDGWAWVIWAVVALLAVHVALCLATSRAMLLDSERPPSARKRRHLWLKWTTGAFAGILLVIHVALPNGGGHEVVVLVFLLAAITLHVCVGAKSLLKDLSFPTRMAAALRTTMIIASIILLAILALPAVMP